MKKQCLKNSLTWRRKQVQKAQTVLNRMTPKTATLRYNIIKMSEVRDKGSILKAARVK